MADTPLVTVIIPAYNTARYIAESVESVFRQSMCDFEAIVINDGSPDTVALERALAPYHDRIRYVVQDNKGSGGARNTGLRLARGRFVAMLDSDDCFHPEYLASQVSVLESDPTLDVVYPDAEMIGGQSFGQRYSLAYPVGGEITFSRVLARECQIYGEVTARTESLKRVGGYDENLRSGEDYDLWLRMLHAGGRIAYNDRVLAYYRVRSDSHTANGRMLAANVIDVLDKASRLPGLSAEDVASIIRQRQELRVGLLRSDAKIALEQGEGELALNLLRAVAGEGTGVTLRVRGLMLGLQFAPWLTTRAYRALRRNQEP